MMENKKFIKEICIKLNFRIEMINDVYSYLESFSNSKTHNFSDEVMLGASIYLSAKLNEDFKRIRDIINVIFFVKNKYDKIRESNSTDQIYINNLRQDNYKDDNNHTLIKTMYNITIENYYILRDEILKAEQHLLRVINYNFESKSKEIYLMLLNYADYLDFNNTQINLAWSIINACFDTMSSSELKEKCNIVIVSILYVVLSLNDFFEKKSANNNLLLVKRLFPEVKEEEIEIFSKILINNLINNC